MKSFIYSTLVFFTIIGSVVSLNIMAHLAINQLPNRSDFMKSNKMDNEEFWKIINYSFLQSNGKYELQETLLIKILTEYTLEQIVEFEKILRTHIIEADDYKIMAAQKIIQGWVTDDTYLYFRCWLIGQGERTFHETLKSPDYLAKIVSPDMNTQFEDLIYVATNAYIQKTGVKEENESFPRTIASNIGLDYDFGAPPTKGTDWTTDQLQNLYPILWSKFKR
jgi:hypothetical protein